MGRQTLSISKSSILIVGLPRKATWRQSMLQKGLKRALHPYGVNKVYVCTTAAQRCRGFAIVDVKKREELLAVESLDVVLRRKIYHNPNGKPGAAVPLPAVQCDGASDVSEDEDVEKENVNAQGEGAAVCPFEIVEETVVVSIEACVGNRSDLVFPFLPAHSRRQLSLDKASHLTIMDQSFAADSCAFMEAIIDAGVHDPALLLRSATDGCAGCGGWCLELGRRVPQRFACVHAVEIDGTRADLLTANARVFGLDVGGMFCVHPDDYSDPLLYEKLDSDVVLLDVPWGGVDYKAKLQDSSPGSADALALGNVSVVDIVERLFLATTRGLLVVLRLPSRGNLDQIARSLANNAGWNGGSWRKLPDFGGYEDRPLVFRAVLGESALLGVACPPRDETNPALSETVDGKQYTQLQFGLAKLDRIVANLLLWDEQWGGLAWSGSDGGRRRGHGCTTAFFDWDKDRWIKLSLWKGCRPQSQVVR
eukprot:TRINITY_DN16493_c0_g1_i1.p1 TRINITY_DN16493_c0_g1~~TRINITY_DN16493_c0_g1_i1.p1  ORF type:complete len:479 (+),score=52.42 TRINITY_DN16493_c0_g1_i1:55-1491(+)